MEISKKVVLEAKNITKNFGDVEILKGCNLAVSEGELISIVGASGAGKSTLLQILGTLDNPSSGEVIINGVNTSQLKGAGLSKFRNTELGFVFQFHNLLPEFTALENVCLPALVNNSKKKEAEEMAAEWLTKLGLAHRLSHKPAKLSGGEQQRVAVARALINNPMLILADEPSGNLDGKNAALLHELFFSLRNDFGKTVIVVTHNAELAESADRCLTIVEGKI